MIEAILTATNPTMATGRRLIDLACGTGRVALALAPFFEEVSAIDIEPEMVAVARRRAEEIAASNVRWFVGKAEEWEASEGHYHLVTIGEAFHRLDRVQVAQRAYKWLAPGGYLVTLGGESFLDGTAPWRIVVRDVVQAFVGEPARRLGAPNALLSQEIEDENSALRGAGFTNVRAETFEATHQWELDDLLGNLRSTSVLSPSALGARHSAFEDALEAALIAFDSSRCYVETIRYGYTLAMKPVAS